MQSLKEKIAPLGFQLTTQAAVLSWSFFHNRNCSRTHASNSCKLSFRSWSKSTLRAGRESSTTGAWEGSRVSLMNHLLRLVLRELDSHLPERDHELLLVNVLRHVGIDRHKDVCD